MSPLIKTIARAYYKAVKDGGDVSLCAKNTAEILKKKNMLGKEKEILSQLQEICNKEEGIVEATVVSRYPLTDSQIEAVKKLIKQGHNFNEVRFRLKIDEKVLGGIKITVSDEVMDATLLGSVRQLEAKLNICL